jgi:DNA-binding transcriptional LysR family regulator
VQGLVAAGVGVALIPGLALSAAREDIAIRSITPSTPAREVIAAVPAGARLAPAAPAMLGLLERAAGSLKGSGRPAKPDAPSVR